ncbi:hypothetical protein [Plantibacter sp. lyk4-40-MEA-4]|uniref:hypothetical protein n=1 Tax=Plantibacter sp. lyk4-40-MEA-4 TaxID=3040298 RepID=UPI00254C9A90|nr:hypothetical protein [Plantibacter sp. lyk4-40-MEA-4]
MLNDEEWQTIVRRLVDLTKAQKLQWSVLQPEIEADPTYFAEVGAETQYRVWADDDDGRLPYRFTISRRSESSGAYHAVESFLTDEFQDNDGSTSDWINDLYTLAARSASGSPQLVSTLLEELNLLGGSEDGQSIIRF